MPKIYEKCAHFTLIRVVTIGAPTQKKKEKKSAALPEKNTALLKFCLFYRNNMFLLRIFNYFNRLCLMFVMNTDFPVKQTLLVPWQTFFNQYLFECVLFK